MKIKYSQTAIRDLDSVWAEVFEVSSSVSVATKYIDDLMDQIAKKADFPKSGSPLYYDGMFTGYYFVVFKSYMAFYKIEQDSLHVSRIVYGKSDYMRKIFNNRDQ